ADHDAHDARPPRPELPAHGVRPGVVELAGGRQHLLARLGRDRSGAGEGQRRGGDGHACQLGDPREGRSYVLAAHHVPALGPGESAGLIPDCGLRSGDSIAPRSSVPTAHAAARAVFVVFAASGFAFASWASRLPAVRDGLSFSEQDMGLLLLTGSIGSVAAIPLSGLVAERIGTARTVLFSAAVLVVGLTVAGLGVAAGEHVAVRVGLVLFGVGAGVWDAAMNLEGATVEQRLGRAVMPVFHAGFSFGTVVGAGVGALVATVGVPVVWHVVGAGALALVSVAVAV